MSKPKLFFLGLDSAEPTLLERWADSGELPGLAAIAAQGATVDVAVPEGFSNGCAWPSLYTGVNPGRHGRYSSATWNRGSYDFKIPFNEDKHLRADPFWVALKHQGKRVGIVDMVRAPLTRGIDGFQIADWLVHDRRSAKTRSYPKNLIKNVLTNYGCDELGGAPEAFLQHNTEARLLDTFVQRIETKTQQTIDFTKQFACDLYMTVYGESHDAGHVFWNHHDRAHPNHDPKTAIELHDALKRVYVALDFAVAKTFSRVDAEYKIIFAGPGMGPNYTANTVLSSVLSHLEDRTSVKPSSKQSERESLRSIARWFVPPAFRAALRKIMPSPVTRAWDGDDMSGRRFFQIPHTGYSGAIRINLRGREPRGCIEPGQEYNELCDHLEARLCELINVESNRRVVSKVVRVHETCSGPALDQLPDLLVIWDRSVPIRQVSLPGVGEFQVSQPGRHGDHTDNAVMLITGPGIQPGRLPGSVLIEDLAPTMVRLLGCEPNGFDGQPIKELFPGA